jgi:hypothetical protein
VNGARQPAGAALRGPAGWVLAAAWGAAEACAFFILPDVLLTYLALSAPRRSLPHLALAVAGAVLGGAGLYLVAQAHPEAARRFVAAVPFVEDWRVAQAARELDAQGLRALLTGGWRGMPYKTYAVNAPGHWPLGLFLLASAVARAARMGATWGLAAGAGALQRRLLPGKGWTTPVAHGLLWACIYLRYWGFL